MTGRSSRTRRSALQATWPAMVPSPGVWPARTADRLSQVHYHPSCTAALEMMALLPGHRGGEVILPSYTFVSTANLPSCWRGVPVFVDIRPDTLNIDETRHRRRHHPRTKAIVPVHYAGVGLQRIMKIATHHNLAVVEDAAQGAVASYRGRALGKWRPGSALISRPRM